MREEDIPKPGSWVVKAVSNGDCGEVKYSLVHAGDLDSVEPTLNNLTLQSLAPDLFEAAVHWSSCDFEDEVRYRCKGCQAADAIMVKLRGYAG